MLTNNPKWCFSGAIRRMLCLHYPFLNMCLLSYASHFYYYICGSHCAFVLLYSHCLCILKYNIISEWLKCNCSEYPWLHFLFLTGILQNGKLLRSIKLHNVAVTCLNWEEDAQLIKVCFWSLHFGPFWFVEQRINITSGKLP